MGPKRKNSQPDIASFFGQKAVKKDEAATSSRAVGDGVPSNDQAEEHYGSDQGDSSAETMPCDQPEVGNDEISDTASSDEFEEEPSTSDQSTTAKKAKHSFGFKKSYMDRFSWIIVDHPEDHKKVSKMWCRLCREHETGGKKGVWVSKPCQSFRLDKIKGHEETKGHRLAFQNEIRRRAVLRDGVGDIERGLQVQENRERKALKG